MNLSLRLTQLLLKSEALRFGEFKTKSGRLSPFFLNFAMMDRGSQLRELGECYAQFILAKELTNADTIFGPAYKGITLAAVTAESLYAESRGTSDIRVCFNRKESKLHGEGGSIVGRAPQVGAKVIVVDDVLTAGTSVKESIRLLNEIGIKPMAVVVGVDRQELGQTTSSAKEEIERDFKVPVFSLTTIDSIVELLTHESALFSYKLNQEILESIKKYRQAYGA